MNDAERYRQEKFESGVRFQDHVVQELFKRRGLVIIQFASRECQLQIGESLNGIEIKHDEKYATTGNLWIEVGEKAMPRGGDYARSGILRDDNSWLYVIGDYQTLFVFAKRNLVLLHESNRYRAIENERKTSLGFLFPRLHAERWAAFIELAEPVVLVTPSVKPTPSEPQLVDSGAMVSAGEIQWGSR